MDKQPESRAPQPAVPPPLEAVPPSVCSPVPTGAGTPGENHPGRRNGIRAGFIVLSAIGLLSALAVLGVTGYFRLSSESTALRNTAMAAIPGVWDQKISVRVGWFTTGLIRTGSRLFNLPPEAQAAVDTIRGASVAICNLQQDPSPGSLRQLAHAADKTMARYGWDRVVGVSREHELVAVYFPHSKFTQRNLRCCVLVLQGRDLVVVSAAGNLEPLLKLARAHLDMDDIRRQFSMGTGPVPTRL